MCSVHGRQWTVPRAQAPLLAFDQKQAFAGEHQEVLLGIFAVVHRARLAGAQDAETEAELRESRIRALEGRVETETVGLEPLRVARIEHEPAFSGRSGSRFGLLERGLRYHRL
ncbi:MAG: hypothetical protein H0W31_09505 [Actinobacteria bacterium]|nr:hypothetical protein [Actinomycetota bacterium]